MDENQNQKFNTIVKEEKEILAEEKKLIEKVKEEETAIKRLSQNVHVLTILVSFLIVGAIGGFIYWKISQGRVYTDKAEISAPIIELTPRGQGTLKQVFVNEGDEVVANSAVALVGNELIKTKISGTIIAVNNDIGKIFQPNQWVVEMIDPNELRVVGQVDEDKGLSDIRIGQRAIFTVDAFGSKEFEGVVDEISPTSRQSDIVFNISDKRKVKQFDVKVRFDVDKYHELKNGMSAKLWIYKK